MKLINKFIRVLAFAVLSGAVSGFSGCTDDGETEIVPKAIEQYKLEMIQFVTSEKTIVENCVVGYNKGDFKSSVNFDAFRESYLTVLIEAVQVLSRNDITIADIVSVNKTLAAPGKAFTSNLWTSDRRPLNDAIVVAEELNTATPEGIEKGQAPSDAKTAFAGAITAAKAVRGASSTIDRQVTETVEKLEEARQAFLKAIIK
jgi:hypothetical protein